MKRVDRPAMVAAVVLLASLAATPAGAVAKPAGAPSGVEASGVVVQTLAEAIATDLALVAKARGWTVEQARSHRAVAEVLGKVQAELASRAPHLFVGGVLSRTPGGTPSLLVKGPADASVRALVASAGIPINLVDRQPYSFAELEARSTQVHQRLTAIGYPDVGTAVDITSARIVATVTARPGLPASSSALGTALAAVLPADLTSRLDITVTDQPVGGDLRAFGGMSVRDDGVFECTSGWSVRHTASGALGVTTAGHCTGINELVDPQGSLPDLVQPFPLQAEHRGQFGDVEWHTAPSATPSPTFFTEDNRLRAVNALEPRAGISVGESVCVYGRASNARDCSMDVFLTSVACTVSGFPNDRLVAMNTVRTIIGGDSGGPWSFDFRAYGSTKGFCTFSGAARAVWSVADLYDDALGVTVLTT